MSEVSVIPIGSFTIFVNTKNLWWENPPEEVKDIIVEAVNEVFTRKLKEHGITDVIITEIDTKIGCLIITFTLAQVVGGISVLGAMKVAYNIVKDYDKLKNNLPMIFNDLKNLSLTVRKHDDINAAKLVDAKVIEKETESIAQTKSLLTSNSDYQRDVTIAVMRTDLLDYLKVENELICQEIKEKYNKHLEFH